MTSEIAEIFEELLFGSGAWIGLIIILSICLIVSVTVKYSGILWCIVLLFMARQYLNNVTNTLDFYAWGLIINIFAMFFIMWKTYVDIRDR